VGKAKVDHERHASVVIDGFRTHAAERAEKPQRLEEVLLIAHALKHLGAANGMNTRNVFSEQRVEQRHGLRGAPHVLCEHIRIDYKRISHGGFDP
jgi:hypothetical protein